jgi:HEAT repeat protein
MATHDPRSVPELISACLLGDPDDAAAWEAVWELRRRGSPEIFAAAHDLLRASSERLRGRGVDILAQLGTPRPSAELRLRCADAIFEVLEGEQSPSVQQAIGFALGHLQDPRAVAALLPLKNHPDCEVRFGVVMGLIPHAESVAALIDLSADPDDDVRNWATFGLGTMEAADTPALRDALLQRLGDAHDETRGEALAGLALRKDLRVVPFLRSALTARQVGVLAVEAAATLGDPGLLPLLVELRTSPGSADTYFLSVLDDAIQSLTTRKKSFSLE